MLQFFHGWRRKAGIVTLVMACGLMGMWVRSQFRVDVVLYPGSMRQHEILSMRQTIYWWAWTEVTPQWGAYTHTSPSERMRLSLLGEMRLDPKSYGYVMWQAEYRDLVLSLALLSAYLLFWKPRKKPCPN